MGVVGSLLEDIALAISELNMEDTSNLIRDALDHGVLVVDVIEKGIRRGMDLVGQKYEANEFFLAELLFAGEIVSEAFKLLEPHMEGEYGRRGKVVLGTVRGDIHDIGKNIFKMMVEAAGFEVIDLGVDVDPETFIEKVRETGASILGMSALLTIGLREMKNVVDVFNRVGIRSKVKILIGGNAVTKEFGQEIGVEAVALNAVEGVEICKRWECLS